MNVTNATVLFRSDTAANFTSANTTLGNATYNAPEAAYEQDTKRVKIGVGNWTTVPYLPNLTQITNLETNVTGLTVSLAGKASTTHGHVWADITGVPSATTGTPGVVRVGSGLTMTGDVLSVTGGGGSGMDRGFFYDIRDYGATVGSANAAANTDAIQDAVDAAAVQSGGWGGGTVYIPATEIQDTSVWDLRTPVWLHGSNIRIMGEGSQNTVIRAIGPAFVVSKHTRFWDISKHTYTDPSGTVRLTQNIRRNNEAGSGGWTALNPTLRTGEIAVSNDVPAPNNCKVGPGAWSGLSYTSADTTATPEWKSIADAKPDLHEFRAAGAFPPTNGNPEFAPARVAALGAGYWFGIRSQKGVAQGRYPYCPLATGDKTQTQQTADLWPFHSKITWEFVVYHHEAILGGGIAGAGNIGEGGAGPDPWMLFGAPDGLGGGTYFFDLALTDKDMVDRTWCRFHFPQNATVGIHRICVQFDPDNATEADRLIAWVDRTRATVTVQNLQWYFGGNYVPLDNTYNGSGTGKLWSTFNRVARWTESDFSVGSESIRTSVISSEQTSILSDYSVLGVSCYATALYTNATSQTKVGGGAADDTTVFPIDAGGAYVTNTNRIGAMMNEFSWSPNADTNLNVNLMCRGRSGAEVWGFLCPKGAGSWGGFAAINAPSIEGLTIRQSSGQSVSCGIFNGPFINTYRLDDLDISLGYFASIGAMWGVASYYGRWTNLKLGMMVHMIHSIVHGENWDFGYPRLCAIRATGTQLQLEKFSYTAATGNDEGFLVATSGGSISAGLHITNGTINQEGLLFAPIVATFYVQKSYGHGNNSIYLDNIQTGESSGPIVYLDDTNWIDRRSTNVQIKRAGFAAFGPNVVARGPDWHGFIEVAPETQMTELVDYREPITGQSYCDLKSIDTTSYGLPITGGYVDKANEIHVRNPSPGGVAKWRSNHTSNSIVYEGSNSPPSWDPIEIVDGGKTQHAISANIYPGIHAACSLPWPDGGNPTTLAYTSMTLPWSRTLLATILTGATSPTRSHLDLRWSPSNAYPISIAYNAGFFASASTANSGLWASAASGSKATSSTIGTTGIDPDGDPGASWTVRQRRRWTWALMLGDNTTRTPLFVGRTNVREPAHWATSPSDTPTVASGGLIIRRASRTGGNWTHYSSNRILDWIVGGSLSLGSTWYFGLSSAAGNPDDASGLAEISGGSYARVAVNMNGTNWKEHFDSGFYSNAVAIEFPAPTADWGRATHWFISDANTLGNILATGQLNRPIRVFNGDGRPTFLPGAFQVQL